MNEPPQAHHHHTDESIGRDELIEEAAPFTAGDLWGPGVQEALAQVIDDHVRIASTQEGLPGRGHPPRRWRSRVAGIGIGTALAIGAVGTTAAAAGIGLWSGWFDSPTSTESVHGEQYVNTSSPGFPAAFDRAAADYPLPGGQNYDAARRSEVGSGALVQLSGLRGSMALSSSCAWSEEWLRADRRHDETARRAAVEALRRISASPDLRAVDGGGIVTNQRKIVDAAAAGDATQMAKLRFCGDGK